MSDIGKSLISAMQQIVDKTIERTPTDVTITATIKRLVEAARNKYEISYGGGISYAYSDNGTSYIEGQAVYVLVPQGDYTNKKIILGKAQEEYGDDTLADDLTAMNIGYNSIGGNLLEKSENSTAIELDAGKKQDIVFLYGSETFIKNEFGDKNLNAPYTLDLDSISNSIKLADYLMITMDINTALGASLRKSVTGKYGLRVAVIYNDPLGKEEITKFYSLTDKDMFGNPMKYEQGSTQHIIFPIEKENFIRIEYIYAYCEDFVEEDLENSVSKIYFKNIQLQLLAPITSKNGDYYLQLKMPKGNTFKIKSASEENSPPEETDILEIVSSTYYKKNSISDSCDHYWGIEDFSIDYNSKGYNKFLGNGWKLLTTSNTSFLKVFRKDNTAYQNNYICVSVYNDNGTNIVLRETFSIFNDDNKIDILIESDCGTSFSFNSGTPKLTCRAFIPVIIDGEEKNIEIGSEEAYPFSDYRYNWTKEDADGIVSFTKTPEQWKTEKELFLKEASENQSGTDSQGRTALQITAFYNNEIAQAAGILEKQDNYIKYSMKNIPATTNSTVFKCSIQKRKGSTSDWLNAGSASITLNNDVLGNNNCQIVIENGTQTFQYSETGISPASEKNQNPIEIRPLRAKFFTANGEEVPESRLNFIRWIIPSESTMINVSSDALTQDPLSGEQYVTSSTLDFSISEIYNLNTINNQIVCSIGFDGKVYRQPTSFFFTKIGQVGTNGTQTTVKIEETGALPDRHSAIIVKPNGSANSVSYSATLFTHNEKLFGYSPKWSIAGSDTKESRYIEIDEENNILLTEKNKNKEDVRIVTAKIPYEGKTYYSSYPVYTIALNADESDDLVYIKKPNTLQFITYNSNGTNPQFNTAQGGIFLNIKANKNYYVEWSALGGKDDKNPAITLSRTGNSNVGSFIISEKTIKEEDKVISEIAKIKSFIQENLDSILTQEIKDQTEIFILNFFNQLNDSFYSLEANLVKCREISSNFKVKIESYEESYFKNSINYANRVCAWLEDLLALVKNYIEAVKSKNNAKNNTKNEIEKIFNSLLVENKEKSSEQLKTQSEVEDTTPKSDKDLYIIEYQKLLNELCNIYEYNLYKKIYDIVKEDDKDFREYKEKLLPREDFKKILEATNVDKNYDTRELNDRFKEEIEKLRTSFESIVLEFDDITPPWFEKLVYIEKTEEESGYKEHSIFIVPAETYNGIYCNNRVEAKIIEIVNDGTEKILATVVIPIHLSLNAYELASVNGWDGTHIEINEEEGYLLSPQLGAGVKNPETNSFTGLVMGSISNKTEEGYSSEKVGLMGFSEGRQSIFLDAKTGAAEFGLAADGADSNDPYSEGRIKLVPNGVSEISKWRIGSKSLFNVKEGNISDAYLDLKQSPLDKNGYEKSVPHDKMGILMSADPSYISIKGKQLFENSGIDFNNANAVIKPGDTMELQLDPNQFSLFTVFRHTSKIDGVSDYQLKTTATKNGKVEIESKDVLYRDNAADEEKMISVYAYRDKKDDTKTVYFKELVFPNEECKIKLDDNSKDETDGFYYPEKNKENNKYIYEYDGSNIEIPLIYMGEEADLKKIEAVNNNNGHIIITLTDGTELSFLKEQFNFDPTFYLNNNDYFIHFYHEKDLLFLKTEEYVAKEIMVEDSILPNPIEEKHIGKYFYDKEKNLYLINKECNKEAISVEESLLPESLGEKEENKYYYDKENKLYLIVKEIVKEEKPIEKIFLPKDLNQEHVGKYYYGNGELYLIDENQYAKKIDIKDSFEKCNVGDYYCEQKRYYHYSRKIEKDLKTYCLPYSSCSVQYANPDAEIGKKLELYKTFNEDSALLVIPEECIFESEFKFVNQVLIEKDSEDRLIGKPAWRREPKVGIDANGRFYTNSLKDNSTALTIGNLGAFGESAAEKRYIGAAFEIESNDGNSSNLLKIFTDKETAESSSSLETTPIYISASGNVDNEYTKPISFYGERISLNAIPNSKEENSKNGAQSKLNLGIIEKGETATSPFARIQSDKNSFLELKGTGGLRSFSLKAENEGTDNTISTSLGIQHLTPPSTKVNLDTLEKDGKKLSELKKQITQEEYDKLSKFTREQIESVKNLKSNLIGNKNNLKNLSNSTLKAIQKIVLVLVKKEVPDSLTLQSSLFSNPVNFATDKKSFLSLHYDEVRLSVKNGNKLLLEQIGSETNKLLFSSNGINLSSSTIINIQNNANISITSGEKNKQIGGKILILGNKASKPSGSTSQKQNTTDKSIVNNDLFENGTGKAYLSLRGYNGASQAAYVLSNGGTYIIPTLYTGHFDKTSSNNGEGVWYVDIAPSVNIPSSGYLWTGNLCVREKNNIILKNGNNAFSKKWDETVYSPSISLSNGSYAITATITTPKLTVGPSSKNTLSIGSSSSSNTISLAYIKDDIASVRSYANDIKSKLNELIKHYNSHVHSFHYTGGKTTIEEKHSHGFTIGAKDTSAHTSNNVGTL